MEDWKLPLNLKQDPQQWFQQKFEVVSYLLQTVRPGLTSLSSLNILYATVSGYIRALRNGCAGQALEANCINLVIESIETGSIRSQCLAYSQLILSFLTNQTVLPEDKRLIVAEKLSLFLQQNRKYLIQNYRQAFTALNKSISFCGRFDETIQSLSGFDINFAEKQASKRRKWLVINFGQHNFETAASNKELFFCEGKFRWKFLLWYVLLLFIKPFHLLIMAVEVPIEGKLWQLFMEKKSLKPEDKWHKWWAWRLRYAGALVGRGCYIVLKAIFMPTRILKAYRKSPMSVFICIGVCLVGGGAIIAYFPPQLLKAFNTDVFEALTFVMGNKAADFFSNMIGPLGKHFTIPAEQTVSLMVIGLTLLSLNALVSFFQRIFPEPNVQILQTTKGRNTDSKGGSSRTYSNSESIVGGHYPIIQSQSMPSVSSSSTSTGSQPLPSSQSTGDDLGDKKNKTNNKGRGGTTITNLLGPDGALETSPERLKKNQDSKQKTSGSANTSQPNKEKETVVYTVIPEEFSDTDSNASSPRGTPSGSPSGWVTIPL